METVWAAVLILAILPFILPVRIRVVGVISDGGAFSFSAGCGILAGLIGARYRRGDQAETLGITVGARQLLRLNIPGSDPDSGRKKRRKSKALKSEGNTDSVNESVWGRLCHMGALARRLRTPAWGFLWRVLAAFRVRRLKASLLYGFESPDVTGKAAGFIEAIRPMLGRRTALTLTPDFTRSRLDGDADVDVYLWPPLIAWAVACVIPTAATLWFSETRRSRRMRASA